MVLVQKLKGTAVPELERGYDKAHAWFFAYPQEEFTLNDLTKKLEVSKTTTHLVINQLVKEGFLEKRVLGKLWQIKANPHHSSFTTRKIPFNLQYIYESGILEWITAHIPNAQAVILFGSYRKGEDIVGSDIDIAVEIPENQKTDTNTHVLLQQLGYRKNVTVTVLRYARSTIDLNVFANIANGIVLRGFLEVQP